MMNVKLKLSALIFVFCLFSAMNGTLALAQDEGFSDEDNSEDAGESAARAGETMASLFGPSARMPDMPHVKGPIALPGYQSSNMLMDETVVNPRSADKLEQA